MNDPNPHIQFFSIKKMRRLTGTDKINAVNKESCRGEIFFVETIPLSPKEGFIQIYDY
jgi:hypothetical protein